VFVAFALASSFWIPRSHPEYPGRRLKAFIGVAILLTIAMLATVLVVGREKEAKGAEHETTTTPQPAPPGAPPPAAGGNAAAGKALSDKTGCGKCHTSSPAGSSGKIGPDLDNVAADAQKAGKPLDAYVHESIADPNAYIVPGFPKDVMPKFPLTSAQID